MAARRAWPPGGRGGVERPEVLALQRMGPVVQSPPSGGGRDKPEQVGRVVAPPRLGRLLGRGWWNPPEAGRAVGRLGGAAVQVANLHRG